MKQILFSILALAIFQNSLFSQVNVPAPEKNDPEAKKLLDKTRKNYERYANIEVSFALTIEVPQAAKDVQKGVISQSGEKLFRLEMTQQTIVSDGKTTWVYLKKNNEVQINDAEPGDAGEQFLTPKELLRRYQKGDFLYAIIEKTMERGKLLTQIEFKPKDKNSEYSKIRVSIDPKTNTIQLIKAFAKDGSRYSFEISKFTPNKKFAADFFTFDPAKFPGTRVEDLRI